MNIDEFECRAETKTPFDLRHRENWSQIWRDSNNCAKPTIAQTQTITQSHFTQMEGANKKKLLFVKNKNKIVEIGVWLLDTEYKKKLIH